MIANRFLLVENAHGIIILDGVEMKRALAYQQCQQQLADGALPSKPLLLPQSVVITSAMSKLLEKYGEIWQRLGFDYTLASQDKVMLRAAPMICQRDATRLFQELLQAWLENQELDALLAKLLQLADFSIRAHSESECQQLLQSLEALPNVEHYSRQWTLVELVQAIKK